MQYDCLLTTLKTMLILGGIGLGATELTFAHGSDANHFHEGDLIAQVEGDDAPGLNARIAPLVSGQDGMVFSWDRALTDRFPDEARPFEPGMHGGFNEDADTGVVYTGIPGYGLCSISADLTTWRRLGEDERLKHNVHGIVVFEHEGAKAIALAQNDHQKILIVDIEGNVLQEISKPTGVEFNFEVANEFYRNPNANFAVTDVTYLDGALYAVTGYSPGDFVLSLHWEKGQWAWGPVAWGGKGGKPGQFNTAHGIFAHEGHIFVANREARQVVKFTKAGEFVETLKDIPDGSRVCNVAHTGEHFIFCPLERIGAQNSAPIYAHTGEALVSTIIPGDLAIPVLNNIHHVWPHVVTDDSGVRQLYLLVHGWNRGKFAVLKQMSE